ncbi:bifunctional P-loop containing nucleoside triphosphate hydrolase/Signal recognition particle receptor [Babesia duncani]|uniref:Signal recognition particle receptor subunit beta n=1 Tax=Babesia duncani TaxID=323732 RepID=A0AAD9PMZ0_9APIC|nr:bifunctional P-loop containing nucleoside triphosphate hydrolase/Signal recognition particle receptor [Babesia duncani]
MLIIIAPIILLFRRFKCKSLSRIDTVLIGPPACGKTALLLRMQKSKFIQTAPSQECNSISITCNKKTRQLLDMPGNLEIDKDTLVNAKGIICMLDSSDKYSIQKGARLIVDLVACPQVLERNPKVLVVANKSDLPNAKTLLDIKRLLQVEIERQVESRASTMHLEKTAVHTQLFSLADYAIEALPLAITLVQASVKLGQLEAVVNFLQGL